MHLFNLVQINEYIKLILQIKFHYKNTFIFENFNSILLCSQKFQKYKCDFILLSNVHSVLNFVNLIEYLFIKVNFEFIY